MLHANLYPVHDQEESNQWMTKEINLIRKKYEIDLSFHHELDYSDLLGSKYSKDYYLNKIRKFLFLYFLSTSPLIIKNVGAITNDYKSYTQSLPYIKFGALVCFVETVLLAIRALDNLIVT